MSIYSWIQDQRSEMITHIKDWAEINTHVYNTQGINQFRDILQNVFSPLGETQKVSLENEEVVGRDGQLIQNNLADGLFIYKRLDAPIKVLFAIHMDTVFPVDHPFQKVQMDKQRMYGPGVADAKGGIAIIWKVLQAVEQSSWKNNLGWQVFFNSDEEIGSPGSSKIFHQIATDFDFALVYEPSLPDGSLISQRKGSGNFSIVFRGKSAHAGRAFYEGKNAIHGAAAFIHEITKLNDPQTGITINVGRVDGGGPANVVQNLAIIRLNIRVLTTHEQQFVLQKLEQTKNEISKAHGLEISIHGNFSSPPKEFSDANANLMNSVIQCAQEMKLNLKYQPSGGVCDGNKLYAAGLTNVDTLGVQGGGIHSNDEYLELDSLTQRVELSYRLLEKKATAKK